MKNQMVEKFPDLKVGDLVVVEERSDGILGKSTTRMHRIKKKTPATIAAGGRTWMLRKSRWGTPSIGEHPAPGRHGLRRSIRLPTPEEEAEYAKEMAETIERCLGLLRAPEIRDLFAEDAPEVILDRWKNDEAKLEQDLREVEYQTQMIRKARESRAILVANVLTGARGKA